jgi:hypothetical protein
VALSAVPAMVPPVPRITMCVNACLWHAVWMKIQLLDKSTGALMIESPKLTDRQQQILDLVQSAIERTGAPPTRAEIAAELGFARPMPPRSTCRPWPARA